MPIESQHERARSPLDFVDHQLDRSNVSNLGFSPQTLQRRERQDRRCRVAGVALEQPEIGTPEMHQLAGGPIQTG